MKRILIAEDEPKIAAFLEKKLRENGFITTVAEDGYEALNQVRHEQYNLLILDLGLPGIEGTEVLEELRGQGEQIPIIILTARDEVSDKVSGLEGGANDYVTKPFSFEELLARIRLQLRQPSKPEPKAERFLKVGDITLDIRSRTVRVGDRRVELSNHEFILLDTLMRHPDQVLTRDQILNYVWGYDYDSSSNIVDVYIGYLRKKLNKNLIETVRSVGYRLRK
ncbi:response regulator transcription factor [Capilliphycus salinus ALCB114379]|uniref:response regulator transcription factor n=1 Tax=Capilliphycus salinus TaxID=2768948 RepID=UPI0039A44C9B